MSLHEDPFETEFRHALRAEADHIDLPSTVWPRLEARLARARMRAEYGPGRKDSARKGDLRARTLALLTDQEMDHYTLIQHLDATTEKARGGLPLLHQLEREGLLSARWQPTSRGVRRVYRAARRGHRVRRWVRGAPSRLAAWARHSSACGTHTTEGLRDR